TSRTSVLAVQFYQELWPSLWKTCAFCGASTILSPGPTAVNPVYSVSLCRPQRKIYIIMLP
ncbi:MAG: hypothetical protein WBI26_03760, partial [Syntrophomonadaceae bacterium]